MIDKILDRIDLGTLSESLLYGDVFSKTTVASCEDRLKGVETELQEQLQALCMEEPQNEDVQDIAFQHQARVAPLYFELGMKAGVTLYRQLAEGVSEVKR